jgi:hypothetical protein
MKLYDPSQEPIDPLDEFDIEEWISCFPLDKYKISGCTATGPFGVAIDEQIRRAAGGSTVLGPTATTDLFVLGRGEPLRRDATKIGGLPFRPSGIAWPKKASGDRLVFLAQFQFKDSKDIVGELPGDVLLIFTTKEHLYTKKPLFHFEWFPSNISDLICQDELPKAPLLIVSCSGVRFRTVDYLDDQRALRGIQAAVVKHGLRVQDHISNQLAYRYHGIKIGGSPFWFNPTDAAINSLQGSFLCSISHVCTTIGIPYPWINVPMPVAGPPRPEDCLYWFDGFVINFFLNKLGKIEWHFQFL